jgi:hypothetical protein
MIRKTLSGIGSMVPINFSDGGAVGVSSAVDSEPMVFERLSKPPPQAPSNAEYANDAAETHAAQSSMKLRDELSVKNPFMGVLLAVGADKRSATTNFNLSQNHQHNTAADGTKVIIGSLHSLGCCGVDRNEYLPERAPADF